MIFGTVVIVTEKSIKVNKFRTQKQNILLKKLNNEK